MKRSAMRRSGHALHKRYGRSADGLAAGAAPWPAEEARRYSGMARAIFNEAHYDRGHDKNPDTDNCTACAIRVGDEDGPNYAGWARLYIEAKRPIPSKWRAAFDRELHSDNKAYANALRRSIATFGGPRFT